MPGVGGLLPGGGAPATQCELSTGPRALASTPNAESGLGLVPVGPRTRRMHNAPFCRGLACGEVFRPLYGHVAAGLHDCWPRHPLTLVLLDYLAETWKVLHLRRSRSAQILGTQLEFQLRYLPAAAEMLTEDMRQCARVHQVPGARPARAV